MYGNVSVFSPFRRIYLSNKVGGGKDPMIYMRQLLFYKIPHIN